MSIKITFEKLCDIIESYRSRKVAVTFHAVGDLDSVSSAAALSEYIAGAKIAVPDFISGSAARILKGQGYDLWDNRSISGAEAVIVVDTNGLGSMGSISQQIKESTAELLFIDHHVPSDGIPQRALVFNDQSFNSAASIVYAVLERLRFSIPERAMRLLLYGIIADSAELKNASHVTFGQISALLSKTGLDYGGILHDIYRRDTYDARKSHISDLFASTVELQSEYVIVYGVASGHPNDLAEKALSIGADIAVFWSISNGEASISARMYPGLNSKLSINLGDLMKDAALMLKGQGGGHPCAAGAYGPYTSHAAEAVSDLLSKIKSRI